VLERVGRDPWRTHDGGFRDWGVCGLWVGVFSRLRSSGHPQSGPDAPGRDHDGTAAPTNDQGFTWTHATLWSRSSRDGTRPGSRSTQASMASGHRVRKRQPVGRSTGLGGSPESTMRLRSRPGTADRSAFVYGWRGSLQSVAVADSSTTRPRYITATRSDTCSTTARSCEMKM